MNFSSSIIEIDMSFLRSLGEEASFSLKLLFVLVYFVEPLYVFNELVSDYQKRLKNKTLNRN